MLEDKADEEAKQQSEKKVEEKPIRKRQDPETQPENKGWDDFEEIKT